MIVRNNSENFDQIFDIIDDDASNYDHFKCSIENEPDFTITNLNTIKMVYFLTS